MVDKVVRKRREPRGEGPDRVLTTMDQIVARMPHIGSAATVERYADRARDPLRIRYRCGAAWIQEAVLVQWVARTFGSESEKAAAPKVYGREAICKAFGRDWRTVLRYAALPHDPLPVEYASDGTPWVYRAALIDWVQAHDVPRAVHLGGWDWKGGPTTREDVCPPVPKKR